MQAVDIVVESACSETMRARQVCSMFDAPPEKKARREWTLELDMPESWSVGLVVGPSGSGKSTALRRLWGEPEPFQWAAAGVIDDVAKELSVGDVAAAFQSVGFNTIPAWLRPYAVLSNGEKFRVELARSLLERPDPIVIDEFTSVVDRQVAKIGSHACQRYVRKHGRKFVAVTCHYDVEDWLQPDWVLDMATCEFRRRLLQRRPALSCTVGAVSRAAWGMFAPFHYMTAELHRAAQCYGLWCEGQLAAFAALLHNPISAPGRHVPIWRVSRVVTLPDYQGLGLAFALLDVLGAEHAALGRRLRNYPAHPSFVRSHERSEKWRLVKQAGQFSSVNSAGNMGGRPNAVFEYVGPAATECRAMRAVADRVLSARGDLNSESAQLDEAPEGSTQSVLEAAPSMPTQSRIHRLAERLRARPDRARRLAARLSSHACLARDQMQPGSVAGRGILSSTSGAPPIFGPQQSGLPTAGEHSVGASRNDRRPANLPQELSHEPVIQLNLLAEMVPESDRRRKILENLDRIAAGALGARRSYTNKRGQEMSIPQPDFNVAVKAMESAKVLLGLVSEPAAEPQQGDTPMKRILAAVPKQGM